MDHDGLFRAILLKRSFLCIGLDSDLEKIPPSLLKAKNPVLEFNKRIIDSTHSYTVAYKPNTAFYESMGPKGWHTLESTLDYIKTSYPGIFVIADAKRGDIGNTSKMYARAFFETMDFDAVTVAPYMGEDSVAPFLEYPGKWVILLALTSNRGADDFQYHNEEGLKLYEKVLRLSANWGTVNNLMYVVGATRAAMLKDIRKIVPEHFLLVPGVGAQGGSLGDVAGYGLTDKCGLLVNSSRAILFADSTENFDKTAAEKAMEIQKEMESHLAARELI